ncbi:transcription factor SOX-4-like isoform X2 [Panicum hallii]|uniref:transcription factor SOX-4-like isoform X2 n=1 Tax=Panicum hallii TaxID=206008 RepID=UPI000DF4D239|nr:transcription factor SOX-4-like isoform X2 [Panicum hallii]
MDHEQRRQRSRRGNAPGSGGGGASSGTHRGGGGKGGGKKQIKVVYISNPMRVKTSAAGFRALVQELTGRDADPSKYSPDELGGVGGAGAEDATAAADLDCGAAHGLMLSPTGAAASCDTVVASPSPAAADHHPDAAAVAAPYGGDYDDEEEDEGGFGSQLLENTYAVLSPPTLLYDHHPHSKVLEGHVLAIGAVW